MDTWTHGHMDTWTHGHMDTWKHGDLETGDMETWKHRDMETWRHGYGDINRTEAQAISLIHLPLAYRANGSLLFVRLLRKKQVEDISLQTDLTD
jgi:hypothetical protein